ncbi:hypothetical protein [Streptomyces violascens]|uniref:hypothetical protein n=1 Tax=Streptomyces violascens TaxID=67381 RepID=UPI0036A67ADF
MCLRPPSIRREASASSRAIGHKRTRFLALGLLVVRFVIRYGLGVAGLALGAAAGQLTLGIVMAVIGTAMAWGDQWLILRTLKHAQATAI